jgi:hypothetical protein
MIETINNFIHDLFQRNGCSVGVFLVLGAFSLLMRNNFNKVRLE